MPKTAPPRVPHAARRAAPHGLPASWAGASERLAAAQHRLPADALTLRAATANPKEGQPAADLAAVWATAAKGAPARTGLAIRRLDSKGRLSLPIASERPVELPAAIEGCILVVHLPGSLEPPAPQAVRSLPFDTSGRLTLTKAVRRRLGLADGAEVAFTIDAERGVLTATAASRLDNAVAAAFDALRGAPVPSAPTAPVPDGTFDWRPTWAPPTADQRDRPPGTQPPTTTKQRDR